MSDREKDSPTPQRPPDEQRRQRALDALDLVDTPSEIRFDRITRIARRLFDVPIALVTLVDRKRQWFKSCMGMRCRETSRDVSFCAHAILGDGPMLVPDATKDARFAQNPLVTADPEIRAYAGCPIEGKDGSRLGTLCVIDQKPRTFGAEDVQMLRDLAEWVEDELERAGLGALERRFLDELPPSRRKALLDPLTYLWGREAIVDLLVRQHAIVRRGNRRCGVAFLEIDGFAKVRADRGQLAAGDLLREVALRIRLALTSNELLGRLDEGRFLFLAENLNASAVSEVARRVRQSVEASPVHTASGALPVILNTAVGSIGKATVMSTEKILEALAAALRKAAASRDRAEFALLRQTT